MTAPMNDGAAARPEAQPIAPLGAAAAPSALAKCELVAWPASGDRAHDLYCHWLPAGHDGGCEAYPTAERLAVEWHKALMRAVPLDRLLPDPRPVSDPPTVEPPTLEAMHARYDTAGEPAGAVPAAPRPVAMSEASRRSAAAAAVYGRLIRASRWARA